MFFGFQNVCHPATLLLLRYQSRAKWTRILLAFRTPRRQLVTVVALVLGCIWLSQAVAAVLFREATASEDLIVWIPAGLLLYFIWHAAKIVTRKPVGPFDWTPAEMELVCAAPLTETQLVSYRLASTMRSALIKSLCFALLMIPDLNIWIGDCWVCF